MKSSKTLRRPSNWQDFETLCKKLWGEIWSCPEIKKNGRSGQNQNGVDIYGIPDGEKDYYGIQCKGKDEYTNKQFTEDEILREIEKAKSFAPPLKKFYLTTTAVKDAKIETFVREKNIEHKLKEIFEVHIFSWEDIVDLIDENRQTHDWYIKGQNYKSNQNAILTFQDDSEEIIASVKFSQKVTEYKQKIISANSMFNQIVYPGIISIKPTPLFDNSINNSYYKFYFRIHNKGIDPIEEFKIFFKFEGDFQDLVRVRNWPGIVPPSPPILYDTILDDDKRGGKISPKKSILVSEDTMSFNDLKIKPIHQESIVNVLWKLTSRNYKTEGILKMNFTPEIIREQKTILIEDPLKVRVVEDGIQDYITHPT